MKVEFFLFKSFVLHLQLIKNNYVPKDYKRITTKSLIMKANGEKSL
jgi:hypothetical protein